MTTPTSTSSTPFHDALHTTYITTLGDKLDSPTSYEGAVTEHLRVSGVYWSLAAISLLRSPEEVDALMGLTRPLIRPSESGTPKESRPAIVDWVFDCYDPRTGGFGGNCSQRQHPQRLARQPPTDNDQNQRQFLLNDETPCPHDGHLLYTLSALQILAIAGKLNDPRLDKPAIAAFISSLQNEDGSFSGDEWGEVDTRFSYCALSSLALLGCLPLPNDDKDEEGNDGCDDKHKEATKPVIDIKKAVSYILSCRNFDGGFGSIPGAESHAGQVFCCIGALSIAHSLHLLNDENNDTDPKNTHGGNASPGGRAGADLLSWWLAERQCDSGGLNGRPEKQADVCYSWWILSALSIMGRVDWINRKKLGQFILNCQDDDDGGIADRPGDMPDVYHTFFGLAGLSLIGFLGDVGEKEGRVYREVDPVFALPVDVVRGLGLKAQVVSGMDGRVDERLKSYSVLDGS
eukprot:CAMPEP_0171428848 /NCGR_PEP_ID=MMETSP0881-20121228/5497_1 /TAXON_ID=67004 /ORGANISM="Thalassiosira weissflogii, Strain CCMP1336" /LENGTH=459 /DNA_ID=CAMNT_0011948693 /DNA_START=12 /DNA_END=1387 /DNA_ORIENTATION=+